MHTCIHLCTRAWSLPGTWSTLTILVPSRIGGAPWLWAARRAAPRSRSPRRSAWSTTNARTSSRIVSAYSYPLYMPPLPTTALEHNACSPHLPAYINIRTHSRTPTMHNSVSLRSSGLGINKGIEMLSPIARNSRTPAECVPNLTPVATA
jgi:hypothetical protein